MTESNQNLSAPAYTSLGTARTEKVELPESTFDGVINMPVMHQAVKAFMANQRQGNASTKIRKYVVGGNQKPWKQKGTGRARHGSNRSPIWVGGGTTHGPRAEKDYTVKINRKMRSAALATILSRKHRDGEVLFVDNFSFEKPTTKDAKAMLVAIASVSGKADLATKRKNAAFIAFAKKNETAEKSFRNIGSLTLDEVRNLNPVDLVTKRYLIIENPTEALAVLTTRLAKKA